MTKTIGSFLGIAALIAAAALGMLAAFGGGLVSPDTGAASPEQVEQREVTASVIGKAVRSEDVAWTITGIRRASEVRSYTLPPSTQSGSFVIIDFTAKNTSERPVTLTGTSMALIDAGGTLDFPAASTNVGYVRPELHILFNEHGLIAPGKEKEGKVIFDLAPFGATPSADLSGFRLRLYGEKDPDVEEVPYVEEEFGAPE